MNTVTMTGTLTKDPELREGGEKKVCAMRLAEMNGGDSSLFINVSAFGAQAESCERYLAKGRHVAVSGRLRLRQWKGEDGQKRSEYSIAAHRVDFLPGARERGDSSEEAGGQESNR